MALSNGKAQFERVYSLNVSLKVDFGKRRTIFTVTWKNIENKTKSA